MIQFMTLCGQDKKGKNEPVQPELVTAYKARSAPSLVARLEGGGAVQLETELDLETSRICRSYTKRVQDLLVLMRPLQSLQKDLGEGLHLGLL